MSKTNKIVKKEDLNSLGYGSSEKIRLSSGGGGGGGGGCCCCCCCCSGGTADLKKK